MSRAGWVFRVGDCCGNFGRGAQELWAQEAATTGRLKWNQGESDTPMVSFALRVPYEVGIDRIAGTITEMAANSAHPALAWRLARVGYRRAERSRQEALA